MSRPTLEMADIVRGTGRQLLGTAAAHRGTGSTERCCGPSPAVAPLRWAVIAIVLRCGHQAISYQLLS